MNQTVIIRFCFRYIRFANATDSFKLYHKYNNSTTFFGTISKRQMPYAKWMFSFLVAIIVKHFMMKGRDDKL